MVEGEGFEPSKAEPSDLQSDPFDRSGTPPNEAGYYEYIRTISQPRFRPQTRQSGSKRLLIRKILQLSEANVPGEDR